MKISNLKALQHTVGIHDRCLTASDFFTLSELQSLRATDGDIAPNEGVTNTSEINLNFLQEFGKEICCTEIGE